MKVTKVFYAVAGFTRRWSLLWTHLNKKNGFWYNGYLWWVV